MSDPYWSWCVPNPGGDDEIFILYLRPDRVELLSHFDHYAGRQESWTLDEVRRAGPEAPPRDVPPETWQKLLARLAER